LSTLIPFMFGLGLLSSLNPCFFPLFPSFLAYIARVENDVRRGAVAGFTCALGIALSFVIYGTLASILAFPLLKYGGLLRYVFGGFVIFLGVIMLTPMRGIFAKLHPPQRIQKARGFLGTFVLGLSYALVTAPCGMPIFLSAILLAVIPGDPFATIAHLAVFGLGAGVPFIFSSLLVATTKGFIRTRYHSIARFFEYGSALVLIVVGLLLLLPAFGLEIFL